MDWYLRVYEALLQSDNEMLEQAIYDSSRAPTIQEMKNMKHLLSIIAKKHGISEVRILDAKSLISSMNLQTQEKNKLLSLLVSADQEEIDAEIRKFLDESKFVDIYSSSNPYVKTSNIKRDVSDTLFGGSRYSPIYRDQILALITWSRAEAPALYEVRYATPFASNYRKHINFNAVEEDCWREKNNIYMNFGVTAYDYEIPAKTDSHVGLFYQPNPKTLFHEIGHVISGEIGNLIDSKGSAKPSMDIAAESTVTQRNNAAVGKNMAFLRSLTTNEVAQLRIELGAVLEKLDIRGLKLDLSTDESVLKFCEELYTSNSLRFHVY